MRPGILHEPYGDRPALGESEQNRPVHTGISDHRGQVGIALLEGREFLDRIRQSGAAFVEAHHGGKGRKTTDERAAGAVLPLHLQVRREARNYHYGRPMTEDLVSDVRRREGVSGYIFYGSGCVSPAYRLVSEFI